MQCAEIVDAFEPLAVVQRPLANVAAGGILLRTRYAGVCHSDLNVLDDGMDVGGGIIKRYRDELGDRYKGLVLGHEICGEVLALGDEVPHECGIKVGETVIIYPWKGCGECEQCLAKDHHTCPQNRRSTTDIGIGGSPGGYATHVPVPSWKLAIKLPASIPPEVGCMLPCSALTVYSGMLKARPILETAMKVKGEARLLVVGLGGLGFWVLSLKKLAFPGLNVRLTAADVSQEKLEAAKTAGADDVVVWGKDQTTEELVKDTTKGGTYLMDAVIDLVGLPKTAKTGFGCIQKGGTLVLHGLHGGEFPVSIPAIVSMSASIQGSRVGSLPVLKELVELVASQGVTPPPMDFIKLEEVNDAHVRMRKGLIPSRAIIKFDE